LRRTLVLIQACVQELDDGHRTTPNLYPHCALHTGQHLTYSSVRATRGKCAEGWNRLRTWDARVETRHQSHPSNWGTLSTTSRSVLPDHSSRDSAAVPSWYISLIALLTASQARTSPWGSPTPYFSSVKGLFTKRSAEGSSARKPARIRSSVETASTCPSRT